MRGWKFSDLGKLAKNSFLAVLKGEFLLRLNIGRYFVHVIYTFALFAVKQNNRKGRKGRKGFPLCVLRALCG